MLLSSWRWLARLRAPVSPWNSEDLIRGELFSVERLEQHATSLAAAQAITLRPMVRRSLAGRLRDNEAVLLAAYRSIARAAAANQSITPAAEWLLDNYHLVEEQIREIREDLPASFYQLLPKLEGGPLRGYPRVFGLAWAFVTHTDSRFDPRSLRRFVDSYQRIEPLTIGELWAVAITLRIVLVDNLRRAAASIVSNRVFRHEADVLADRLLGIEGIPAEPDALTQRAAEGGEFPRAFVVELVQRLRDQDPKVTPALRWLEQHLNTQGTTAEQIVRDEHQRQGSSNVTVRNIITSMRLLSDLDWTEFFESVSLVDTQLRGSSDFQAMDFATRTLYRSAVEELARGSGVSEIDVARAAVAAAAQAPTDGAAARAADPGFHLIAEGRPAFERRLGYRVAARAWPRRIARSSGIVGYLLAIAMVSLFILGIVLWSLQTRGPSHLQLLLLAMFGALPALDAAIALVNRAAAGAFGATILPALALRDGIPPEHRTLVVVPALLTTASAIESQVERLEVHFLASPDPELYFALLSDWVDATEESLQADQALLDTAVAAIARLNEHHGSAERREPFLLLHRRRVWSAGERRWMGWERKRGKLHEVNRLLRGQSDTTFIELTAAPLRVPANVRYVVTLDADTRLPRECVRRLVGKMAHPLNSPHFDSASGQVSAGYAVLQPRVAPSLPVGREGSRFQRIFSSASGIDPYAAAASDVYQDLFAEGSYAGKGIYHVDAFEAALAGRVKDGAMLSHDLFEGIFARAGLVSDIQVVEEFPSRYDVAVARQHRWARGDWQLLPWLLGRKDAATEVRTSSRLSLIGLWKILDNLRRTLSAPAGIAALALGWTLPVPAAWRWSVYVLLTIALPALLPLLNSIIPHRAGISLRSHLYALRSDLRLAASQTAFLATFLSFQAWLMIDAVLRTLFRLAVSRRNLLQWVTAAQSGLTTQLGMPDAYRRMSGGVALAVAVLVLVAFLRPTGVWLAAPIVLLWLASPALSVWISISPSVAGQVPVTRAESLYLRGVARQTWRYFENFVTVEEHMLPPDNFQENPRAVVAHRTSPTNIGLYLLAVVSARDFGWIGTLDALERLEATLATLGQLERFRGHLYNWYDTRDLRPLEPRYVSSVDSGNLAAHLLALANSCRGWSLLSAPAGMEPAGIEDSLRIARDALQQVPDSRRTRSVVRQHLVSAMDAADTIIKCGELAPMADAVATMVDIARTLVGELGDESGVDLLYWLEAAQRTILGRCREAGISPSGEPLIQSRLAAIEATARAMAVSMDFGFLLDVERRLLSIGYRAAEGSLDPNCYDLLASEARLASFVAIALDEIPAKHWFRLGRAVTPIGHGAALISWSGSMFEYLMPSLVLRAPADSLLAQTNHLIVQRQIGYGAELGIPWGMSESAYNARDLELTYQYSNFGVPGLGLKRGLSQNTVVAPYATALAAMVNPAAAARNFLNLQRLGARGRYGFFEALDYTRSRVPEGSIFAIVQAYMAHHQGMTLVALANVLFDGRMRDRFHSEPIVKATELLLQERTPRDVSITHPRAEAVTTAAGISDPRAAEVRRILTPHQSVPQVHLLSNGRYAVMLTTAGSGYSRWGDLAITRWQEDVTRDDFGSYIYLRDVESGSIWTAGYQPSGVEPDRYEVTFTEDRAEFVRVDATLTTTLEVLVSPEDDAEVRRLSVTNAGNRARDIDVTSYVELALATPAADAAHPAFSKMFIQTEYEAKLGTILANRRRASTAEPEFWAAHQAVVEGEMLRPPEVETDRARFIGRGRDLREPVAVWDGRPLSNTVGTVLDPIFALRYRVRVPAGGTVRIAFWTAVSASRQDVLDLLDKHHDANAFVRAATLAWTQAQVQLRHLGIDAAEAGLFQRLASHVLLANPSMRSSSETIARGAASPAALWAQGISGDLPIVLLRIDDVEEIEIARQLLRAHEYWRMKSVAVDLVILNERATSYVQDLQIALETQVRMSQSRPRIGADGTRGAVFVLRMDLISEQTRATLVAVARVVLAGQRGTLLDQLDRHREPLDITPRPSILRPPSLAVASKATTEPLEYFNGLGGFGNDAREYVTVLEPGQCTPAPWINVIANPHFGFQVATEGSGYTWSRNSRENQLTPWSNDPVADRPGEALYVCDGETGELWCPTAAPIRCPTSSYTARHSQGYSRFEHSAYGIGLELLQFVPLDDPIKLSRLRIHNTSDRTRWLSLTAYAEWVLGQSRSASAPFITTALDSKTNALLARNTWGAASSGHVAFADLGGEQSSWTCDRREFLGRHGTLARPAALTGLKQLSGRTGAGLDPCAALQTTVELEPDQVVEIIWLLGEAVSEDRARALILKYRNADLDITLKQVRDFWDSVLGTVQIRTPDRALDIMVNRWLLYQTLVCRVWARSAFYQASGAYGFRDQLQDSMALAISTPALAREHLLRAAGRQFLEGDVQHWWLPHTGQGVRTRISDDRIWLAFVAAHYVQVTGDLAVLDERTAFLEGQLLRAGEHDVYFQPTTSDDKVDLFEHCARALDSALQVGVHGLPLIGTGDWNDGLNCVGEGGFGESIWLAWFLYAALEAFAPLATARGQGERAAGWRAHAVSLQGALQISGWDGEWYRRAYFDDGTPLGAAGTAECTIDAIAQSWAVLSGAAPRVHAENAMASVTRHLIRADTGLALLFAPPFDHSNLRPGYIKAYPPGIRENGGQYTHAAAWSVMAYARLGQGTQATALLSLLNPVNRSGTRAQVHRYKVEPYVVAADVYSIGANAGRGGWTWYTGSAGWMYRAALESILGFQLNGAYLALKPCLPAQWPSAHISFRYRSARYEIEIEKLSGAETGPSRGTLDGLPLNGVPFSMALVDDGAVHQVRLL
ncbi:MAG: glucoamylase family protein, partial [Steroidobacteraceae bacterium]